MSCAAAATPGARKGSGNYHLIVSGKAAHAGRAFHEGANAVAILNKKTEKESKNVA